MRICLAYDCLYPWTVGGAERWYRSLGERLAADGHDVTYLTRLQWDPADPPDVPGVRVLAVSRADPLYGPDGNRRVGPPLRFGRGVLGHLLRHGREYDVVHLASFPYFSVLAAAAARPTGRYGLVVDWFEVWSDHYWREYLGGAGGRVGSLVQRICARVPQRALCFSRLHERRLLDLGLRGPHAVVGGLYAGTLEPPRPVQPDPLVVFAGRMIREKGAPAVVGAIARAREDGVDVRGLILGDGPEHGLVVRAIEDHGLTGVVEAPGFVDREVVDDAMRRALCLVQPSSREGYGLVVVEAAAHGTPVVVVAGEDNASVELVEPGVNGLVAETASAGDLAACIAEVASEGLALRERTCDWFAENAARLSLEHSLDEVAGSYRATGSSAASRRSSGTPPATG